MSHRSTIAVVALVAAALILFQARKVIAKDAIKDVVKDPSAAPVTPASTTQPSGPLDFVVKDIDGKDVNLAGFKGKVVMIVNVASKCGNTPQYAGLEKLYKTYKDQGFVILGFPANNFGRQEPGTDLQIKQFCTGKYNVTFPMMSKISVNGDDQAPLYKFLTEKQTDGDFAGDIDWNFAKFLIDRNGNVMARFTNSTKPDTKIVTGAIEKALAGK
jgi:glutathione peroxidase